MDVNEAIKTRRSIRKYKDIEIERDKLEKVLEAARLAPSAKNMQNWKFIAITDSKLRDKIAKATSQAFVEKAPVLLIACGLETDSIMKCGENRYTVDVSIATAYMTLQARELGLGTCWLGHFDQGKIKEILKMPEDVKIVSILTMGYPNENPDMRKRKTNEEVISFNKY